MDTKEFVRKIERLAPLQAVTIRFAEDGMTGLYRLKGLLNANAHVELAERDKIIMSAVVLSRDWGGSHNRNYTVTGLSTVDTSWTSQLARDVESIKIADHPVQDLMAGRQKVRERMRDHLIDKIATQQFWDEIRSFDCAVDAQLEEPDEGFPLLHFTVFYSGEGIASVSIDGWSGRIIDRGQWSDVIYSNPEQVRKLLVEQTEHMLDKITAPPKSATA